MESINHKIVGSDIVAKRKEKQKQDNVWSYIETINSKLRKSPIKDDLSLDIGFFFTLSDYIIEQIISAYSPKGWIITVKFEEREDYPGYTVLNFKP